MVKYIRKPNIFKELVLTTSTSDQDVTDFLSSEGWNFLGRLGRNAADDVIYVYIQRGSVNQDIHLTQMGSPINRILVEFNWLGQVESAMIMLQPVEESGWYAPYADEEES